MNKIAFFSVSEREKSQLGNITPKIKADYHSEKLTLKNLPNPQTEILAIHIDCLITAELLQKLPNLKLIVTRTAGIDHIDLKACTKAGVMVANCAGLNALSVAEFTFGLLLSWYRHLPKAVEDGKKFKFQDPSLFGNELSGKTLGIVGTGAVGGSVARIARGFGMNILGFDARKNPKLAKETGLKYVPLAQLVKQSDIVTLHVPAIASTNKMISDKLLAGFKTGAVLVNTARGAVVSLPAVLKALAGGKLGGYLSDVLEIEDVPKNAPKFSPAQKRTLELQKKLAKSPKVLLTPHVAHATFESNERIFTHTFEIISAFQKGKKFTCVN